jgi:hypothetical protein
LAGWSRRDPKIKAQAVPPECGSLLCLTGGITAEIRGRSGTQVPPGSTATPSDGCGVVSFGPVGASSDSSHGLQALELAWKQALQSVLSE